MKKILSTLGLFIMLFSTSLFSQNVGIGTTSPTNTLHVIVSPTNPNPNPVRFEGIQRYTTEDSVLVVNPSTGVVKYMPMADVLSNIPPNILDSLILSSVLNNTDTIYNNQSVRDSIIAIALGNSDTLFSTQTFRDSVLGTILSNMDTIFTITRDSLLNDSTFINTLRDSIDTDIDSVTFANDTIYIYENGTIVQTYINTSLDTALVDSLILASSDTLYTIISDSLTKDTNWIKQIDSLLSIYGDTIYFNDSTYTLIKDSLLNDTAWLSELQDSINTDDQNIDSLTITGTILTTYIEDGTSASVNVSSMLDSVIFSKSDTLYSIISDSLTKDSLWIKQIDSLLSIYGDTIYFNDSSYTLVRDSLLNDSLFLDSLVSLIGDSINTDDQNIDSLTITGTILTTYIEDGTSASVDVSSMLDSVIFSKSDTLYSIFSDSLTKDSLWIKQIDSLLSIYGDTIYFNDSSYTLVRDSLLNDSLFLDSLVSLIGDSINTDDQNIDSLTLTGTILTTYIEDGASATIDLQPIIDSAIANSTGTDDQNLLTPTLTGTVLNTFIENGASTSINLNNMLDSVILSKSDTLYSIISDSLTKDSLWIKQIDSLLSIYGDTIYFNDTSYTLIRDSLLNDSLFMDSLISLIGDSIDTDIDSVVLIGDTLHIYEDGVDATADISGILDSIRTVDSLFTPDYVIFADSNGRLSEDTVKHFKTVINNQGDRALLLNTDSIINTGNSNWSQLQAFHKAASYESVVSLEDGYVGLSMAGQSVPVLHLENRGGTFSVTQPIDTSIEEHRATGTIIFLGKDSTASRGTQATIQGTSKFYDNQSLLTGFLFTGRTRTTPANPKLTLGYNFPHFHNNSELLFELNNDGNGSIQAHFYKDSRNDTTPINNFLYTDANGVFQSKSIDTLIQLMRDSLDDADWNINANTTGLEAAPAGDNVASGAYSIAAGQSATASGDFSTASGGQNSTASNNYAVVSGGVDNTASGYASFVGGGDGNTASGSTSVVSGGNGNYATGNSSTITGGNGNQAIGNSSFIGGGASDTASGINSVVAGGLTNKASGNYSVVSGGVNNKANNYSSVISGGDNNSITGDLSFIGSGDQNNVAGENSGISVGFNNSISNDYSFISGGSDNNSTSQYSSIGGGYSNTTTGDFSSIGGGTQNIASGLESVVGGGDRDTASGENSTVAGGIQNNASGQQAFVGGGTRNRATNVANVIAGGQINEANGPGSVIVGGFTNISSGQTSFIGAGISNTASGASSVVVGGTNNLASAGWAYVGGGYLDTATGSNAVVVGGRGNKATGSYTNILGGYENINTGSYSAIGGGYRDSIIGSSYAAILSGSQNRITSSSYATIPGGYRNKINSSSYANVSGYDNYVSSSSSSLGIIGYRDSAIRSIEGTFIAGRGNISMALPGALTGRNAIFGANNRIIVTSNTNNHSISILGGTLHDITGTPGIGTIVAGGLNNDIDGTTIWTGSSGIFAGYDNFIGGVSGSGGASGIITGRQDSLVNAGVSNIVGGQLNKITSTNFAGIFSGRSNSITGAESGTILGGINNTLFTGTNYSSIIGGDTNGIANNADNAVILGGRMNIANNFSEVVLGHYATNIVAAGSSAGSIDPDNILLKIGNGTDASNRSDAMVVKANGNVGIGVFNPSEALEVSGNILASGTITPSDERYKTNINTLDNALENLLKLRGVSYEMKNEYKNKGFGDGLQIGVIAQEVEKIYPELIQTNKQTGYKGVDYSKFTPILIEAVKEQQDIINTNKEEIETLKTENEELKERLNKLEETLNKILEK